MKTLLPYSGVTAPRAERGARITCARDVYRLLAPQAKGLEREHAWRIDLDARKRVLGIELVGMGTVDRVTIAPREVFRGALRANASAVILAHNHLAGDSQPSILDRELTQRLVMCGLLIGIELFDHAILAEDSLFSFKERLNL